MKKVISLFICVLMCVLNVTPALANIIGQTDNINIKRDDYAQEIIKTYIEVSTDASENDIFNLSQAYTVNNDEKNDNRIYFLFKNGICIGQLSVAFINNRFTSTFFSYDIPVITTAYKNSTSFSLWSKGESLFFVSENAINLLNGPSITSNKLVLPTDINSTYSMLNLSSISYLPSNETRVIDELILDVIYRSNYELSNGHGICWAACDASIGEYHTGTRLTAYQLYIYLSDLYNDQPEGNEQWKKRAIRYYGLTPVYQNNGLSLTTTLSRLNEGKPIHAGIERSSASTTHGVVICGYKTVNNSTNYCLKLMDPNVDANIWTEPMPYNASAADFVYTTTYTYVYDNWLNSMWVS